MYSGHYGYFGALAIQKDDLVERVTPNDFTSEDVERDTVTMDPNDPYATEYLHDILQYA